MAVFAHFLPRLHFRVAVVAAGLAVSVGVGAVLPTGHVHAREKKAEDDGEDGEVDYIELAALMLRDGHLDRADSTLRQVDLTKEGVDKVRFFSLRGLLRLKQKLYAKARDDFRKSIRLGNQEPVVHRYLAQALFGNEEYEESIEQLEKAGEAALKLPAAMQMWAEAHFKLGNAAAGFGVLEQARERHPDERSIHRALLFRYVEAGLYQHAIEVGQDYLKDAEDAEDYVAFGEALRQGHQLNQARQLLERALLRFPGHRQTTLALTHVYVELNQPLTAAMLLESLARFEPELALEVAELYRRAGRAERALLWNIRVPDQTKKLRQRLSILVSMERFGMVASMEDRLSRLKLLEEDKVRYAVAYSLFKLNEFDRSERHLRKLKSAAMFEQANQLRRAMESCRERGWECI